MKLILRNEEEKKSMNSFWENNFHCYTKKEKQIESELKKKKKIKKMNFYLYNFKTFLKKGSIFATGGS